MAINVILMCINVFNVWMCINNVIQCNEIY